MVNQAKSTILTLNVGSASLKFAVYHCGDNEALVLRGQYDRVGLSNSYFVAKQADGTIIEDSALELPDFDAAVAALLRWLPGHLNEKLNAVGHRVVHGGSAFVHPTRIDAQVQSTLKSLVPLAPNHLPAALSVIASALAAYPDVPQVACFDTAFHATMPASARTYALPQEYRDAGLQRYGFHGLSYQSIVDQLETIRPGTGRRVVIAHLGNGASLCGLVDGLSVDTTMGLTPLSGIPMSTRCGDLDPEVVLYLAEQRELTPQQIRELLTRKSGLLGLSGSSADVRELLAAEANDPAAAASLAFFCYAIRKAIATMTAACGGIDELVFTAGIGEHSPVIRARAVQGLAYLGILLDPAKNQANAPIISQPGTAVEVRILATNEERIIAHQTNALLTANIET